MLVRGTRQEAEALADLEDCYSNDAQIVGLALCRLVRLPDRTLRLLTPSGGLTIVGEYAKGDGRLRLRPRPTRAARQS